MSNDRPGENRGRLFLISAPSGAGKTTLVRKLMTLQPDLRFSISYTTRDRRPGEMHGRDYFFVTSDEFESRRDCGDFLENAVVFGYSYGTSRSQVSQMLETGHDVILEIDWQGAEQVRQNMAECISIFVLPPSLTVLEERLRGRATDSEDVIQRRLKEAVGDISHWPSFDHVVFNETLDKSVADLMDIIMNPDTHEKSDRTAVKNRIDAMIQEGCG